MSAWRQFQTQSALDEALRLQLVLNQLTPPSGDIADG
jgi:hypothetical protein